MELWLLLFGMVNFVVGAGDGRFGGEISGKLVSDDKTTAAIPGAAKLKKMSPIYFFFGIC